MKQPFASRFVVVCTNETLQDVVGDRVQPSIMRCFDRLVCRDANKDNVAMRLGFKQGDSIIWYAGAQTLGAGEPCVGWGKVWLPGDWVPFARFEGAAKGDKLELYTFGYTTESPD